MRTLLTTLILTIGISVFAQQHDVPVQINLKDGTSINVKHFGQLRCGTSNYGGNYILVRGKYMGTVTEVKDYKDIEKIVFVGYTDDPAQSVGNQKATVIMYRKDGVSVELTDTEIVMSCYGVGDLYNQIIVQIENPLTKQAAEKEIAVKDIQSVIFR